MHHAKRHQLIDPPAVHGVTKFSDLTPFEFRKSHLGLHKRRLKLPVDAHKAPVLPTNDLPTKSDWSDHGAVTGVKDQVFVGGFLEIEFCEQCSRIIERKGVHLLQIPAEVHEAELPFMIPHVKASSPPISSSIQKLLPNSSDFSLQGFPLVNMDRPPQSTWITSSSGGDDTTAKIESMMEVAGVVLGPYPQRSTTLYLKQKGPITRGKKSTYYQCLMR